MDCEKPLLGCYGIMFCNDLDVPPEMMVGETVFDSEGQAIGWVTVPEPCRADETDTWECVRDDMGGYGKTLTVHVMECTECGHTYEYVNGDYKFCPRCGRKRIDA